MNTYRFLMEFDGELDADLITALRPQVKMRRMRAEIRRLLRLGINADGHLKTQGIVLTHEAVMNTADLDRKGL